MSAEFITFLNCDLTLIYLLLRVGVKARNGMEAGDLLEIGVVNRTLAGVFIV